VDTCCPFFVLSSRQREVLALAALGQTDQAIGLKLSITPRTVRAHLQAARVALGALNTTHAVTIALTRQLISFDTVTAT
jgi:DNA-binding NarL/FixJ family response regulator